MDLLEGLIEKRKELGEEIQRWRDKITAADYRFTSQDQESWETLNDDYNDVVNKVTALERTAQVEAELRAPAPIGREISEEEYQRSMQVKERRDDRSPYQPLPQRSRKLENRAMKAWLKSAQGNEIDKDEHFALRSYGLRPGQTEWDIPLYEDYNTFRNNWQAGREYRDMDLTENAEVVDSEVARRIEVARLAIGPIRAAGATVIRTATGAQFTLPTSDDTANDVEANLLLETNAMNTTQTITTGQLQLDSYKYTTHVVLVSQELIEDSIVDIISFAIDQLATRVARGENDLFTTADGSAKPQGLVPAATQGVNADITADGLFTLFHSVDPSYRNENARWMAHDTIWETIRVLKDTTNQYLWQPGLQRGQPDTLLGFPTVMNQSMVATQGLNDRPLLFGDISKFIIRDVASGLRLKVFRELYGASDQVGLGMLLRIDSDLLDAGTNPVKCFVTV